MLAGHGVTAVGEAAPGQQRPCDHRELVSHAHRAVKGMCSVTVEIGASQGKRRMRDGGIFFHCSG